MLDKTYRRDKNMRDITYCVSKSCPKASKCDRWWMNNFIATCNNIQSMADFYKKGAKCEYYIRKENPNRKRKD